MSARDDYMLDDFSDPMVVITQMGVMCDEIDRLRTQIKADDMVRSAVDSLTRELTAHADAMRDDLAAADGLIALAAGRPYEQRDTITAYDEFVREC